MPPVLPELRRENKSKDPILTYTIKCNNAGERLLPRCLKRSWQRRRGRLAIASRDPRAYNWPFSSSIEPSVCNSAPELRLILKRGPYIGSFSACPHFCAPQPIRGSAQGVACRRSKMGPWSRLAWSTARQSAGRRGLGRTRHEKTARDWPGASSRIECCGGGLRPVRGEIGTRTYTRPIEAEAGQFAAEFGEVPHRDACGHGHEGALT